MKDIYIYRFNIFYLVVIILWPLLKNIYFDGIDGAGRIEFSLMLIAIFTNMYNLRKSPKTILIWAFWIIYVIISLNFKGFKNEHMSFHIWISNCLFVPLITMIVAYNAVKYNYSKTISILFWSLFLYVLLGSLSMSSFENYDGASRMANELGNAFFNNSIIFASFAAIMYSQGKLKKIFFYFFLIFVIYIILKSGERKGLICVFIITIGALYAQQSSKGIKAFMQLLSLLLVSILTIELFINYSTAGNRLVQSLEESEYQNNWFLKLMGDRGIMYYMGWDMFLNNPWTGIGVTNYSWQNGFMYGLPFHTEYMVQLAECGLIGTILFILFYYGISKKLIKCYKNKFKNKESIIYISTFLAILIINLVSWTYDNSMYFMMYGIILGFYELRSQYYSKQII